MLFDAPAPPQLVRPTVGVFWSALLGAAGRIESIPLFFIVAGVASLGYAVFIGDGPLRRSYTMLAAIIAVGFDEAWGSLSFTTANVDFAAFVFTFIGVLLLLDDDWNTPPQPMVLLASALMLGIAAAVRGPMIVGGAVMLLARWRASASERPWRWMLVMVTFAAPLLIDGALRQHFGIRSNASGFLFCMYWDPSHSPTSDCATAYAAASEGELEIIEHYVSFVFSRAGGLFLAEAFATRVGRDLSLLTSVPMIAIAMATLLMTSIPRDETASQRRAGLLRVIAVLVAARGVEWLLRHAALAGALSIVAVLGCVMYLRAWRALACLAAYLCGTMLLCVLGVPFDRYASTFDFLLYLGVALCALDTRGDLPATHAVPRRLACTALALTAFLYVGSSVLPSTLRDTYRVNVAGRAAALKIADDPAIDRSIYLTGARELVYTHHDHLHVGDVRRFTSLASPGVIENASYREPNAFVD